MSAPLLELQHVTQVFSGTKRRFVAIEDVNLAIREGEFVALVGPSGCGKSTLLRIAVGLASPTEGRVLYRGAPLHGVNPRAAVVFQSFALFPWLTVRENVELALKARGVERTERRSKALALLAKVGLDGFEAAYPRELSGGMRQKVGFARAMAIEPELLCLDEPFSALDVLSAQSIRGELLELWTQGSLSTRAILMVTHNIEEAVLMADRIAIMEKGPGRIVAEVPVALPRPRSSKQAAFHEAMDRVYAILAGETGPEHVEHGTAPGEAGRTRALPRVTVAALAALLEYLAEAPERRADIYRLPGELHADSEQVLRATEASELLGFATVAAGDVHLTDLGASFAAADMGLRKQLFAARVRRLPLFKWLAGLLETAERRGLRRELVEAALEIEFPPEEAREQLDTALKWGRYAELLGYDDRRRTILLER